MSLYMSVDGEDDVCDALSGSNNVILREISRDSGFSSHKTNSCHDSADDDDVLDTTRSSIDSSELVAANHDVCDAPAEQLIGKSQVDCLYDGDEEGESSMNHESTRLGTFRNWPTQSPISPNKLTKAGFYYTGEGDIVTCYACGVCLGGWRVNSQPLLLHRNMNSDCPFASGEDDTNVPLPTPSAPPPPSSSSQSSESSLPWSQSSLPSSESSLPSSQSSLSPIDSSSTRTTAWESHTGDVNIASFSPEEYYARESLSEVTMSGANLAKAVLVGPELPSSSSSHGGAVEKRNDALFSLEGRVATYKYWPLSFISPTQLARAGFFYTGLSDHVKCVYCEGVLNNWRPEDSPLEEHRRLCPECPYLRGDNQTGLDETGCHPTDPALGMLGVDTSKPATPNYATLHSRLLSFNKWPGHLAQRPRELAEAGFYYIGSHDNVKCFYCDGGLRNWEAEDEPWTEHARLFPLCPFVKLVKGPGFVKSVQERYGSSSLTTTSSGGGVEALMHAHHVTSVIEMGFDEEVVREALGRRVDEAGRCQLQTAEAVLEEVLKVMQERREGQVGQGQSGAGQGHSGAGQGQQGTGQGHSGAGQQGTGQGQQGAGQGQLSSWERSWKQVDEEVGGEASRQAPAGWGEGMMVVEEEEGNRSENVSNATREVMLEEENRALKEQRQCKICMDRDVGVVFMPCGHMVACVQCAPAILACPMCRASIRGSVRAYLS